MLSLCSALIILLPVTAAWSQGIATPASPDILMQFSPGIGQWMPMPKVEMSNDFDLWTDQREDGSVFALRIDLNGDGVAEWFIRTLCGTGGCEFPIFDGKNGRHLGNIFGSRFWLLRQRVNGLPVIEAYGRLSVQHGKIARYEYDGSRYVKQTERDVPDDKAYDALNLLLQGVPVWEPERTDR
jgi:hypothetical protein